MTVWVVFCEGKVYCICASAETAEDVVARNENCYMNVWSVLS